MENLLLSKPIKEKRTVELAQEVEKLLKGGIIPNLKVILVGHYAPSLIYTRNKKKFIESIGAKCEILHLKESTSEDELKNLINQLNLDHLVHGLFVQLPLPTHLQKIDVGNLIVNDKDVDGLSSFSFGNLLNGHRGDHSLIPCTPKGIIEILKYYKIELTGKNVVIIGRSAIVGKPLSLLMCNYDATVTLCHSKTKNLKEHTLKADIIISAIGNPRFLTSEYFSNNKEQVVIDVGINHDEKGVLCGDIDFDRVQPLVKAITPVPGGVGPMTILGLAQNLILAAKNQSEKK